MSSSTITAPTYTVDDSDVREGPGLSTVVSLGGTLVELDPDGVATLQRLLEDTGPRLCIRCSGERFTDASHIKECGACAGEGWTR